MSEERDEAEAQRRFEQQMFGVDYEPESMWWGQGGFRMSMSHNANLRSNRARRALRRLELDDARRDEAEMEEESDLDPAA